MESMGKKPRQRRSFTPEFKAEIVELAEQVKAVARGVQGPLRRAAGPRAAARPGETAHLLTAFDLLAKDDLDDGERRRC